MFVLIIQLIAVAGGMWEGAISLLLKTVVHDRLPQQERLIEVGRFPSLSSSWDCSSLRWVLRVFGMHVHRLERQPQQDSALV